MTSDLAERARDALASHSAVKAVKLVGSRARGDATRFSDWDFEVETDDFRSVADALPALTEPLQPLAAFWDPLANHATYMLIEPGPVKVDFIFEEPWQMSSPYTVDEETLLRIDAHFWDWILWLTSKVARGKQDVVQEELQKMQGFILGPMGASSAPTDLAEAVDIYLALRARHEQETGVAVPRELGAQVSGVVKELAEVG